MELEDITDVTVIGAGTMGHGITQVVAMAGYDVTMRDVDESVVQEGYEQIEWSLGKLDEKGQLDEPVGTIEDRIETAVDLERALRDADLVIEATPEDIDIKHDVIRDVEASVSQDTLVASNTSSIRISDIAAVAERPENIAGMHFFNPPVKMDLVEVTYGEETADETAETVYEFAESLGKTPIYVRKDDPEKVVNSIIVRPYMVEAAWILSEEDVSAQEIDAALVYGAGYPMGPNELNDMGGIDIAYKHTERLGEPNPPLHEELMDAGDLGRKTGRGIYDYENGGVDYEPEDAEHFDPLRIEARMVNEAAKLVERGVATPHEIDTGMRLGAGFPHGICQRGDVIGLDRVLETLEAEFERTGKERFAPAEYLRELVKAGKTGTDAGRGFFTYVGPDRDYLTLDHELGEDGVLSIEIDRPSQLNALSQRVIEEIEHLLDHVDVADVRCVVFSGSGDRAFSAGADINEFQELEGYDLLQEADEFRSVAEFPVPTIAKIRGICLGAGLELALACDIRVASEGSQFGFPEAELGIIPGASGTQRMVRLVGEARTMEMIYRALRVSASEAEQWGFLNTAVPDDELDDHVAEIIADIAGVAPIALRAAKQAIKHGDDASFQSGVKLERLASGVLFSTDDMHEGVEAFIEDREPEFTGE